MLSQLGKRSYSQNAYTSRRRLNPKVYRKKTGRAKMSAPMYRQVKAIVDRARETKYDINHQTTVLTLSLAGPTIFEGQINPFGGSSSINRIGNKISPTGARFRAVLRNTSTTKNVYARMLYMSVNEGRLENVDLYADFFEGDLGTDVPANGTLIDLVRRPNKEMFKVLRDDIITLGYVGGSGSGTSMSPVAVYDKYIKRSGVQSFHDVQQEYPS